MFREAFPIISTPDLPRALAFYRDALQAPITYQFPDDGAPVYVSLSIGSSQLGLAADDAATVDAPQRMALWVYVDDCDAAAKRLRHHGAEVLAEPADQPWGERVARLRDPDGNLLLIGAPSP